MDTLKGILDNYIISAVEVAAKHCNVYDKNYPVKTDITAAKFIDGNHDSLVMELARLSTEILDKEKKFIDTLLLVSAFNHINRRVILDFKKIIKGMSDIEEKV